MRLIIVWVFSVILTIFTASTVSANELERCLQRRLDAVLAGEHVSKHANIKGLLFLALGRANHKKIADDPIALKRFEDTVVLVLSKRIRARAGEFVGAQLKLKDTGDKASIEGVIIADGEYFINITFAGRAECKVNDVSIHGHFKLRDWVREQPEIQALMKEYKLAR